MTQPPKVTIVLDDDGAVLVVIAILLVVLASTGIHIAENARQRRRLVVTAGANQELRQRGRMFFYTVLVLGLLTLAANYLTGITSSMAASHIGDIVDPISALSLPGVGLTAATLAVYALAIIGVAGLFLRHERIELPELLADLNDARKFGALDSPRQLAHLAAELERLCRSRDAVRAKAFTDGEFAARYTSEEALGRPRLRQQLRHLHTAPGRRDRTRYFHRRLFLNYRLPAGKWLYPLALVVAASLFFAVQGAVRMNDAEPDFFLPLAWGAACVLGVAALAGQYRCEVGKVLLKSRKEFIADQTEAECRKVLAEAASDLAEAALPVKGGPVTGGAVMGGVATGGAAPVGDQGIAASAVRDGGAGALLRIGRWEVRHRRREA